MLRFTCPTTRDITLDDLRLALLNFDAASKRKEKLLVRIEDTDKERNIEGKDQEILDVLALFGIEYSQVNYQSQNYRFHSAMALDLLHRKKAFNCFCPLNDEEESYDGRCENLPAELVIDNLNPFTVRIKSSESDDLESFIILQQDKTPSYDFASAVDDMLSDISLIITHEEYKNNALKQEHIRKALGYDKEIEYRYIPSFTNETPSIKSLLEEGFLPSAISNYLISNTSTLFDKESLLSINKEELKNLDNKELSRYVGFADEEIGALAKTFLDQVSTTKELRTKIAPIFAPKQIPSELKEAAEILIKIIAVAPHFEEYEPFKNYLLQESQLQKESFDKALSFLLIGVEDKVDLSMLYPYLKNYIKEVAK